MTQPKTSAADFRAFGLCEQVLRALDEDGYQLPTPVQQRTIPCMLAGGDVIGQAQTGTGKTAAFALPLLSRMRHCGNVPTVLVLTPTRELAIQVGESFRRYGRHLPAVRGVTLYGGADIGPQLRALRAGVHVVVGTPGRVMDHLRRGSLDLSGIECLVLDEADEMLRMGFIEDVEWILEHTPTSRQTALFSATIPIAIQRIAQRHLRAATHIKVAAQTQAAATIRQRFCFVGAQQKLEILGRLLEVEETEGVLVFVRTRSATTVVADALSAAGFVSAALHGEVAQHAREKTVEALRTGALDIVVATDVAARGLDVKRISHVINFDLPSDPETYVHRIGRTGRAGRSGEAIILVTSREQRQLRAIERATRQSLQRLMPPSVRDVSTRRNQRFKERVRAILATKGLDEFETLISEVAEESGATPLRIAAALARELRGEPPLLITEASPQPNRAHIRQARDRRDAPATGKAHARCPERNNDPVEDGMERYRLEVGRAHGVLARHIVGAIANEGGLEGRYIGRIQLHEQFTLVELPVGMPKETQQVLEQTWVCARQLRLRKVGSDAGGRRSGCHSPRPVRPARPARAPKLRGRYSRS